jgi:hypothetical protein
MRFGKEPLRRPQDWWQHHPAGAVTVSYGGGAAFTIQPDPEYQIDDVFVNGISVGALSAYSFTNVTSDQTSTPLSCPSSVERYVFRKPLIASLKTPAL